MDTGDIALLPLAMSISDHCILASTAIPAGSHEVVLESIFCAAGCEFAAGCIQIRRRTATQKTQSQDSQPLEGDWLHEVHAADTPRKDAQRSHRNVSMIELAVLR